MNELPATKIKLFGFMVPRPGLELQEFHDHYRHPHGTWGSRVAMTKAYVQSHRIDSTFLGPSQGRFDCVAEIWFDSIDDFASFRSDPMMSMFLNDDEKYLMDFDRSMPLLGTEEVIASGPYENLSQNPGDNFWSPDERPFSIKIVQLFAANRGRNWTSSGDKELGLQIGALRHVRSHALSFDHSFGGAKLEFGGVRELWWPTLWAFQQGIKTAPAAWATLTGNSDVAMLVQAERYL